MAFKTYPFVQDANSLQICPQLVLIPCLLLLVFSYNHSPASFPGVSFDDVLLLLDPKII